MAAEQPKKITGGAFGRYMAEHRTALLKETAGQAATASIKIGSERFKALGEAEKTKYQKLYEEAKQKYEKDMAAFLAGGGQVAERKKKGDKKEKKQKDPNKPKKPTGGGFGCYLEKHRQALTRECEGKPITAVSKLAGERWKALSAEEKKPFEAEYATKKAAYEKAMKDYVPPAGAEKGDDDENDDEEDEDEVEAEESPAKTKAGAKRGRSTGGGANAEPPAKRGRVAGKAAAAKELKAVTFDEKVLNDAKSFGYEAAMLNLAAREDVVAAGFKGNQLLDALKKSNGLVNSAKRALLGA